MLYIIKGSRQKKNSIFKDILLKKVKCVCVYVCMYVCVCQKNYFCQIPLGQHKSHLDGTGVRKRHIIYDCTFMYRCTQWKDDLQWKMTFNGRRHSMEDDIQWKTTFNGRRAVK